MNYSSILDTEHPQMICSLVPSSQGAFMYPVPVTELFKHLLISAWREKWVRWNQTIEGQTPKTASKQSRWHEQTVLNAGTAAEPVLPALTDEPGENTHLFVYSLYLCSFNSQGHMWRGDALNVAQFVFPQARNTVGWCANTWTAAETLQQNLIGCIILLVSSDRYHSSWVITPLTVYQWDRTSFLRLIIQRDSFHACSNS